MPIQQIPGRDTLAPLPRVHIVVPTHTPRHLASCLSAIAWQSHQPDSVVVTCDTDDPAIADVLGSAWPRIVAACSARAPRLIHTFRPHQGQARPSQVRNNGLRALEASVRLDPWDLIIGIDGDIVLSPDAVRRHLALAHSGAELTIGFRVCLEQEETARLDADAILAAAAGGSSADLLAGLISDEAEETLRRRQRRYERQLTLREAAPVSAARLLLKPHKPKIISAHFAATVSCLREANGFDERYVEYGYEDDDLGRRLHALLPPIRTRIAVESIPAFHLWHPSRAPSRPMDAPGFARFSRRDLPAVAERGWRNPMPQPEPVRRTVGAPMQGALV